jgi:phage gp29-like protein
MTKIIHKKSTGLKNVKEKSVGEADIYNTITYEQQLFRVSQDIGKLRNAITQAESIQFPQRYNLYQVYIDSVIDSHLSGCISNFKNLVLSREINFYKKDGTINEETSAILKTKWFRDFVSLALDSRFWGHSLIQLGNVVEDGFSEVELIPRIYVKPELHIVTEQYTDIVGRSYYDPLYKNWVVSVGDPKDLGLLMKASFLTIWKKTALGAWAEFTQIFGTPTIVFSTNTKDKDTMIAADKMLKAWRSSQKIVKTAQDDVKFEAAQTTDASKVFLDLANFCNSEISKLILGQTSTMDEKAFSGSANVHKQGEDLVKHAATLFIEDVVNRQLKPILAFHGFPVNDEACKITDNTDVGVENKIKIDLALIASGNYKLNPEYLKETYGTDVESVEQPKEDKQNLKKVKNALDELYRLS